MSDAAQAAFAQRLAEACGGPAARRSDWTVATDDWLTARLDTCSACARPGIILRGIIGTRTLIVGYSLCGRCVKQDGVKRAEQVLTQRYETDTLGDHPTQEEGTYGTHPAPQHQP